MSSLWVWLIGCNVLAFAALFSQSKRPYVDGSYWLWLLAIMVWVFGGVFFLTP